MSFNIELNNLVIAAEKGETILAVLNRIGLNVPTLCFLKDLNPTGACRMCVVEVEGFNNLVTSCTQPVEEFMKIKTHSKRVLIARQTNLELLLANHPDECLYCIRNRSCELQHLAQNFQLNERKFKSKKFNLKVDKSSSALVKEPDKCILCGRCIRVCDEIQDIAALCFIKKGSNTTLGTTLNKPLSHSSCINCGQCIMVCPTAALHERNHIPQALEALENPKKHTVVFHTSGVSFSIGEEFGFRSGKDVNGLLNSTLTKIGFHKVFDLGFASDIYLMELADDLMSRIQNRLILPLFSACCPSWIKFAEQYFPDILPSISRVKSPQQIMGSLIKTKYSKKLNIKPEDIFTISAMPCIARKYEAQKENINHSNLIDVDCVLSTRELANLIKLKGSSLNDSFPQQSDNPFTEKSSADKLLCISGGLIESLIRILNYKITGKDIGELKLTKLRVSKGIKEFSIYIKKFEYHFAVVNGIGNARKLINDVLSGNKTYHFVEVMACKEGCINGGGQPLHFDKEVIKSRIKALYDSDEKDSNKFSYKNPSIPEFSEMFSNSEKEKILNTDYTERTVLK
ncbi:MAG: [Fe-Fe] hydrogenase large subunit C-terminal domain-containing protein [Bacteroidota bacterium]